MKIECNESAYTEAELKELQEIFDASHTRELTREEYYKVYRYQGWDHEWAEHFAENGPRRFQE